MTFLSDTFRHYSRITFALYQRYIYSNMYLLFTEDRVNWDHSLMIILYNHCSLQKTMFYNLYLLKMGFKQVYKSDLPKISFVITLKIRFYNCHLLKMVHYNSYQVKIRFMIVNCWRCALYLLTTEDTCL